MIAHFVLFLLRPLPDFSLATWDLAPLSHHHMYKRHHMLIADEDLSIPELSSRNKRNRRKLCVQFAESMGSTGVTRWMEVAAHH